MRWAHIRIISLSLLLFVAGSARADNDTLRRMQALPGAEKIRRAEELAATPASPEDRRRVIVTLQPASGRREADFDLADMAQRSNWRQEVASAQATVLGDLQRPGHELLLAYDHFPALAMEVDEETLEALLANPIVEAIEPDSIVHLAMAQAKGIINVPQADAHAGGAGITIAIIDDGVDYLHPQLGGAPIPNSKVIMGVDLAEGHNNPRSILNTHGTACAGIAAGSRTTAGGDYTGGVAPDAKIAAVKVFGDGDETAFTSIVMAGIDWSIDHQFDSPANPIMVLNMSISGGRYTSTTDCWISNPSFFFAVDAAVASGMTVVVASGNNGFCDALGVPACLSPVISVGAIYDETFSGTVSTCLSSQSCFPTGSGISCPAGQKAGSETPIARKPVLFSNTASFLSVLAPGAFISTTDVAGTAGESAGDYYHGFAGTSAAAPFVAGAAAVIQSVSRERTGVFKTPAQVKTLLTSTGTNVLDTKGGGRVPGVSTPLINVEAALDEIPLPRMPDSAWMLR